MIRHLCFLVLFWNANTGSASFVKPCKDGDDRCIKESAQATVPLLAAGDPKLGLLPLDPLEIPVINSNQGPLKLAFTNTILKGLKGCKIENIKHERVKGKETLVLRCDMTLEGDYVLDGQLLILPVQGKGKYKIDIRDIIIKTATDLTTVKGPDGKEHWKIVNWRESFQVKTGVTFHFDNLFNGNKVLADPMLEFVNSNWKDVMQEVAPPIVKTIVSTVYDRVDHFYAAIPAEELYIH